MKEELLITESYKDQIRKSPSIMAVRFVGTNPVEVVSRDFRFPEVRQFIMKREQILAFENPKIK